MDARNKALVGVGGAITAAASAVGLLGAQTWRARRRIGVRSQSPPYADARYSSRKGASVRLVMIGDSLATSLGARDSRDTIGARLASLVAEFGDTGVLLRTVAEVGSRSRDLDGQVTRALFSRPHVVVIIVGANDVTHGSPNRTAVRHLGNAVRRLRQEEVQVIVGTTPDLGTVRPIQQPLRSVARHRGRKLAAAQAEATVAAGGRAISLADILGPEFRRRPGHFFSEDAFHPNTAGYEAAAQALAPSVLAALSRGETGEVLPERYEVPEVAPLDQLARRSTELPGAEISRSTAPPPRSGRWRGPILARMGRRRLPDRGPTSAPTESVQPGAEPA